MSNFSKQEMFDREEQRLLKQMDRINGGGNSLVNGYIAYYKGKQLEVYAENSYRAQVKAAELFKAKKSYEVTVMLCEKDGQQVTHSTSEI